LHVAGAQGAAVPQAVAVIYRAGENIGDRLDSPVGVPGEPGQILLGALVAKIIEQQERIVLPRIPEAERPPEPDTRSFDRRH
jgi:hypothetical protein